MNDNEIKRYFNEFLEYFLILPSKRKLFHSYHIKTNWRYEMIIANQNSGMWDIL